MGTIMSRIRRIGVFIVCTVLFAALLDLAPVAAIKAQAAQNTGKKYVIQIVWDGLSANLYNQLKTEGMQTPNIDQLIGNGTKLDNVQTTVPSYGGAEATLITGASTKENGFLYRYYNKNSNTVDSIMNNMKAQTVFESIYQQQPDLKTLALGYNLCGNTINGRGVTKQDSSHLLVEINNGDLLVPFSTVCEDVKNAVYGSDPPQYILAYSNDIKMLQWNGGSDTPNNTIQQLDQELGSLIDALKSAGIYDQTTIILNSLSSVYTVQNKVNGTGMATDITTATGVKTVYSTTGSVASDAKAVIVKTYIMKYGQLSFTSKATQQDMDAVLGYLSNQGNTWGALLKGIVRPADVNAPPDFADYLLNPADSYGFTASTPGQYRTDNLDDMDQFCVISGAGVTRGAAITGGDLRDFAANVSMLLGVNPPENNQGKIWNIFSGGGTAPAAPTIIPPGGTFATAQSVAIGNVAVGDTAYYTLDGANPTVSSHAYAGPFTVTGNTTVTAAVYDPQTGLWSDTSSAIFAAGASEAGTWTDITGHGPFRLPYGIAVDHDGSLYAANTGYDTGLKDENGAEIYGNILKLSVGAWTDIAGSPGQFKYPYDIAVDDAGNVYVADTYNHRIKELPKDGAWTDITGSGFDSSVYPCGIAVDGSGGLFVSCSSGVIKELPKDGAWTDITGSGGFKTPYGIAADDAGDVYVADSGNNRIKELVSGSSSWTDITYSGGFNWPFSVAVDDAGNVYAVDTNNNKIKELASGSSAWTDITGSGVFNKPYGIAADDAGDVYVADTNNYKIQMSKTSTSSGGSSSVITLTNVIDKQIVKQGSIIIEGSVSEPCALTVDGQAVALSGNTFSTDVALAKGLNTITFVADVNGTESQTAVRIDCVDPDDTFVCYINWDGFAKYYYDLASTQGKTPVLDSLTKDGVLFTNGYTGIPSITGAMQPAILSGAWPATTGNAYRYFDKTSNVCIQNGNEYSAENIAEAAERQGLTTASVNLFPLQDRGTSSGDPDHLYVTASGLSDYADRFNTVEQLVYGKYTNEFPRFMSFYMDDLDGIGHNEESTYGVPVVYTEQDRVKSCINRLSQMDAALGHFIQVCKDRGIYDNMAFVLTADHGMAPFGRQGDASDDYQTKLPDLQSVLSQLGYKTEVLYGGQSPHLDTDIVIVDVGLQAQLSFTKSYTQADIDKIINAVKDKVYVGKIMQKDEMQSRGCIQGFADLIISPKPPYSFKTDSGLYIARGQHDSLDDTAQHIFALMWGKGVKKGYTDNGKIYNIDFARTMAKLMNISGPKDATGALLNDALLLGPTITLNLPDTIVQGGAVHVTGSINKDGSMAGVSLGITVNDANGATKYVNQTASAADGTFSFDFGLPADAALGTWQVSVAGGGTMADHAFTVHGGTTTVPVTSVTLDKASDTLAVGAGDTLVATVAPPDATNTNVTWSSDKPDVANVDANGRVTAVAVGTATITVTTVDGGKTATCVVTVQTVNVPVTVVSATAIPGIKVSYGTKFANVSLPVKATVNLSNGVMASVSVTWDGGTPVYSSNSAGAYAFSGTLGNLPDNVANPDNIKASMQVTVLQQTQPTPVTSGITEIPVTAGQPQNIEVPQGVTPPPITTTVTTTETGQKQTTLPLFNASIQQTIQNTTQTVLMQIPDQTTATGSAFWNGQIQMPHVVSSSSVTAPGSSTINLVLQMGDPDLQLTFDKAVRILLPGMAGKSVGYTEGNGDVIPIDYHLSADTQQSADTAFFGEHPAANAGYISAGQDLAVWMSHFCKLVVYSAYAPTSGSGGGGGAVITAPGVQTADAASITGASATLNGSITASGGTNVTAYGFLWGTGQNNLDQKQQVGTDNHSGSFQASLSGLKPETTYYFRAYATNSQGTTQGSLKQFTTVKASTQQPQPPVQPVPAQSFTDVPASHWGSAVIADLSSKGYISGYPDGSFHPDGSITRAEFTTIIAKSLGLSGASSSGSGFADLDAIPGWAKGYVAAAAKAGLVSGYSDGTFKANDNITRAEIAVIVAKALYAGQTDTTAPAFTDASQIPSWAAGFVAYDAAKGILSGYPNHTFQPGNWATRAEACAMIVNMLRSR